jgi:hypothetical protein
MGGVSCSSRPRRGHAHNLLFLSQGTSADSDNLVSLHQSWDSCFQEAVVNRGWTNRPASALNGAFDAPHPSAATEASPIQPYQKARHRLTVHKCQATHATDQQQAVRVGVNNVLLAVPSRGYQLAACVASLVSADGAHSYGHTSAPHIHWTGHNAGCSPSPSSTKTQPPAKHSTGNEDVQSQRIPPRRHHPSSPMLQQQRHHLRHPNVSGATCNQNVTSPLSEFCA